MGDAVLRHHDAFLRHFCAIVQHPGENALWINGLSERTPLRILTPKSQATVLQRFFVTPTRRATAPGSYSGHRSCARLCRGYAAGAGLRPCAEIADGDGFAGARAGDVGGTVRHGLRPRAWTIDPGRDRRPHGTCPARSHPRPVRPQASPPRPDPDRRPAGRWTSAWIPTVARTTRKQG
jgi:hypothetical protein